MTLRARLGIAAGVAVAIAVIAVVVSAYAGTRSELVGQLDNSLRGRVHQVLEPGGGGPGVFNPGGGGPGDGRGQPNDHDPDEGLGLDRLPPQAFGGAAATVALIFGAAANTSRQTRAQRFPRTPAQRRWPSQDTAATSRT